MSSVEQPVRHPDPATVQDRRWVGRSVPRKEDPKLLTGRAAYVGDVTVPGMLHAAVLRSPHPNARIRSIDTSRAAALPGVDPISMLLEMAPLVILYEISIVLAKAFGTPADAQAAGERPPLRAVRDNA